MNRLIFLFDGFNVYHALQKHKKYHKYKWLDYAALAKAFAKKTDEIVSINYFTAYWTWKQDSYIRHQDYIAALKTRGVKVILGKYKERNRLCKNCNKEYIGHEEKQTDVNIAVYLIRGALLDEFDTAVLVTADSDLVPAIRALK